MRSIDQPPPSATPGRVRRLRAGSLVAGVALAGLVLAACGDDTTDTGAVEVSGAWARTSPMMASAGAAYMELTSADGDRLIAVSVDPSIAGTVEIHETVPVEGTGGAMDGDARSEDEGSMGEGSMGDDDAMDGSGAMDQPMTMRELAGGLELPAGETVSLAPGGYHVMLLDLAEPLEVGDTFDLALTFETGGVQTVAVEVRDDAP